MLFIASVIVGSNKAKEDDWYNEEGVGMETIDEEVEAVNGNGNGIEEEVGETRGRGRATTS